MTREVQRLKEENELLRKRAERLHRMYVDSRMLGDV